MQKNEGNLGRIIRAALGFFFLGLAYFYFSGVASFFGYVFGAVILLTAITGFCGLYSLLGINTRK
jgi:hypothetical protein